MDLIHRYFTMKSGDFKTVHEYCMAFDNVRLALIRHGRVAEEMEYIIKFIHVATD